MTNLNARNKLFARLLKQASFTHTPRKDAETKAIREYEAEGLINLTDISGPYDAYWRIERAFRP